MEIKYKWVCECCEAEVITIGCTVPDSNGCSVGTGFVQDGKYLGSDGMHKWKGEPLEE